MVPTHGQLSWTRKPLMETENLDLANTEQPTSHGPPLADTDKPTARGQTLTNTGKLIPRTIFSWMRKSQPLTDNRCLTNKVHWSNE